MPGCGDDHGDAQKRKKTLGVNTVCQNTCVKQNVAVSCYAVLTAGATEVFFFVFVFFTCRAHVSGVQQKNRQMVLDTQTAKGKESPEIHGLTCTSCKFDEIPRSSSAHHSTETRRRVADLIFVLMVARIVYISHGECGGHHHSVSTKPLLMSARNSDAHFSGRVGASARFSFEGTRHARSSTA